MDIPDVGTVEGFFDLRGTVDEYLGHVSFRDKRVLEIGPASGFLTFQMEKRGAEVVAVDVSESFNWDTVPYSAEILDSWGKERWSHMDQLRKGFWFAHRRLQSRAKVHYGSAYELPETLGRFDVSVMGAVLLHNRDPLRIVHNCARITEETIIIAEVCDAPLDDLQQPLMKLVPSLENEIVHTWWSISPECLRQFLQILGFSHFQVETHSQKYKNERMEFFTLVARR